MKSTNAIIFLIVLLTSCAPINYTSTPSAMPIATQTITPTLAAAPTTSPILQFIAFEVYNISVSPNGEMLVLTASTGVWVYRLSDTKILFHHKHTVKDSWQGTFSFISWSPDGTSLAVGKPNTGVWVWNTSTWELQTERNDDPIYFPGFAWSPDGSRLALGGNENEVLVWDKEKKTWENKVGFTGSVFGLTWASNGQLLVLDYGGLYDAETGELSVPLDHSIDGLSGYTFWSPNKNYVYVFFDLGGGLIDIEQNKYLGIGSCCYSEVAWSLDGGYFAATPWHDNEITVWDVIDQKVILNERQGSRIFAFAWTPTGRLLAAGSMDGKNVIWDTGTQEILFKINQ